MSEYGKKYSEHEKKEVPTAYFQLRYSPRGSLLPEIVDELPNERNVISNNPSYNYQSNHNNNNNLRTKKR